MIAARMIDIERVKLTHALHKALISIGDKVAWWPVQMPMSDLKTLQNCDEFPAHD